MFRDNHIFLKYFFSIPFIQARSTYITNYLGFIYLQIESELNYPDISGFVNFMPIYFNFEAIYPDCFIK